MAMMSCEQCEALLSGAVDGSLNAADEASLQAHCAACGECRALLEDLLAVRGAARRLDRHEPPREIWDAIAARTRPRASSSRVWPPLAAAAAIVLAIAGGTWQVMHHRNQQHAAADAAAATRDAEREILEAETHYNKAIAALETLTAGRESTLDPKVALAIAESVKTIDGAIAESRAALRDNPDSVIAQSSLLEALRMKVALLQETVSLVNAHS